MFFDTTLRPIDIQIGLEGQDESKPESLQVVFVSGLVLPIDTGNGQAALIPAGVTRFPLIKQQALDLGRGLIENAEKLQGPSGNIAVASSLSGVEKAAQMDQRLRGGGNASRQ